MTAHWVVLAAVALTTLVAAVVGAALAAFADSVLNLEDGRIAAPAPAG